MSIVKSLTDQANIANDYNDRNLARLCMTSADEIEKLRNQLDAIMAIEAECFSLRDCDEGMKQIKHILYTDGEPKA